MNVIACWLASKDISVGYIFHSDVKRRPWESSQVSIDMFVSVVLRVRVERHQNCWFIQMNSGVFSTWATLLLRVPKTKDSTFECSRIMLIPPLATSIMLGQANRSGKRIFSRFASSHHKEFHEQKLKFYHCYIDMTARLERLGKGWSSWFMFSASRSTEISFNAFFDWLPSSLQCQHFEHSALISFRSCSLNWEKLESYLPGKKINKLNSLRSPSL